MKIPKLEQLLQEKTVLVLGAGASVDYGFPLWGELNESMKKAFSSPPSNSTNEIDFSSHAGAEYWREKLKGDKTATVDSLAAGADDNGVRLFQEYICTNFLKLEANDRKSGHNGWIEGFGEKFINLLIKHDLNRSEVTKILGNLTIVSLNYDRVFAWRFGNFVRPRIDDLWPNTIKRNHMILGVPQSFTTMSQPHGSLGQLTNEEDFLPLKILDQHHQNISIRFGKPYGEIGSPYSADQLNCILPVDLLNYGSQGQAMNVANTQISNATFVLVIGMSSEGITQSKLALRKPNRVFYTGSKKVYPNFIPLSCNANELISQL